MSKIDFQNGFALGFASKGKIIQKTIHADSSIVSVMAPIYIEDAKAEITYKDVSISSGLYYPVKLPQEYVEGATYYTLENNQPVIAEVNNTTEGTYYRYSEEIINNDSGEIVTIADFSGENTLEFVLNEDLGGLYATQFSLDAPLENNTVYTIIIDEGLENETSEKLFGAINEDSGMLMGLSANPNQNNIALMQVADNEYILASLDGTLMDSHTIKILKDTNDMSESYVVRLFDDEKLDIVATNLSTDKNYTVSITNSSGGLLYSDNETFETTSGMFGMVDYDIDRGETYEALSSGEKCTLQIIDNSDNSVVISSSDVIKSQVTFMGGTVCECYCWGNENIVPYTSFGT